jgi:preprotein translocase subunit SecD
VTIKQKSILGTFGIALLAVLAVLIVLPGGKIPILNKIVSQHFNLGLDLQGGTQLIYQANLSTIQSANKSEALQGVRDVIERRVNAFGVAEPRVQLTGGVSEARIVVELAGIKNPDDAIKLIGETPILDFREETIIQAENIKTDSGNVLPVAWKPTELTGRNLKRADVSFDQNSGAPQISLTFDSEGAKLFADITGRNVGKRVGIFLDGAVLTAPTVQTKISDGQAVITGTYALDEAKLLATRLNAGALPVPITLISRTSVGPTLGRDSLGRSMVAGLIGLLTMVIYMIVLYRYPGVIAAFALILYALLNLAVYKVMGVTMTLAGIAGLILSIGMAVDANVLIFERLKEELRNGHQLIPGVIGAFNEAWSSIRDSNVASLITCSLLYMLGSSIVKGFAVTLAIGIVISMFSAITVTRTLLQTSSLLKIFHNKKIYTDGLNSETIK